MKWEILCLTMPSREKFLVQMLSVLKPQLTEDVRLTIKMDDGSGVGEQRHKVKLESRADYFSILDDDDFPSPTFVSKILPLLDGTDYVGFRLYSYDIGSACATRRRDAIHSLLCSSWYELEEGYFRDISHFNPMRTELSMSVPMSGTGNDDFRWASEIAKRKIVRNQHFINEPMIHYFNRHPKNDALDIENPDRLAILRSLA